MRDGPLWCLAAAATALTAHAAVNAALLRRPTASSTQRQVAVLLPVRNEAHRLRPCLESLLAQQGATAELLVLDDGSTDGTADLVRQLGGDRLSVITGAALPPGWLGKPHACQQLADAAGAEPDVLVFVDADVVLAPTAVAATVALLDELGWDFASPYPRQLATGAQRLVQPLLQWSWLTLLPLRWAERSPHPALAVANGQLLAVRRTAYQAAGGHAAVRTEVVEDLALARALRRAGSRGGFADGTAIATTRMYADWTELVAGYTKSARQLPAPAVAGLLGLYLVPAVAALRGSRAGRVGYLAGVAGRCLTTRRTGARMLPDSLAHPVSVAVVSWLWARSRWWADRTWKGRPV